MTTPARPVLYFVRHGETDWNAQARLQGQRDVPLNGVGIAQAEEAGRRLLTIAPDAATLDYVASPLGRTVATMEGLRPMLGLETQGYRLDDRLKELSFGAWEGMTWKEVRRHDPAGRRARDADRWHFCPPGAGAESYAILKDRIAPVIDDLQRPTVMVAHGGVARAVLVHLGYVDIVEAVRIDIWQGRVLVLDDQGWRWV